MLCEHLQALQAPACHENLVKVGGYILGEFGNLIAGDSRSRYKQHPHEMCLFVMWLNYTFKKCCSVYLRKGAEEAWVKASIA